MSVLLSLPSHLCHFILFEWIKDADWCKLDTACCNDLLRCQLMIQFQMFPPVRLQCDIYSPLPYNWCCLRSVHLKNLDLKSLLFDSSGKLLSKYTFEKVECLNVEPLTMVSTEYLVQVINSCINMKNLIIPHFALIQKINVDLLSQLTHLKMGNVDCNGDIDPASIMVVKNNIKQLKNFTCYTGFDGYLDASVFCEVIYVNPLLQTIVLTTAISDCSSIFNAIIKTCQSVHYLILINVHSTNIMTFNLADIVQVQQTNPKMIEIMTMNHNGPAFDFRNFGASGKSVIMNQYNDLNGDLGMYLSSVEDLHDICLENMASVVNSSMLMNMISKSYKTLHNVDLLNCNVSCETLKQFLIQCKQLVSMRLHQSTLTNDDLIELFAVPNQLETLHLDNGQLTPLPIIQIIRSCTYLSKCTCESILVSEDISKVNEFVADYVNIHGDKVDLILKYYSDDEYIQEVDLEGNGDEEWIDFNDADSDGSGWVNDDDDEYETEDIE